MNKIISIPGNSIRHYDALYIISDLHMGGRQGFQIFNAGMELQAFIGYLQTLPPERSIGLVINGDLVDFLAEKPAMHFDPEEAVDKLDRIIGDPAFSMVWSALHDFISMPNRSLIITLGNHDLELALPWVRAHLLEVLSKGNNAALGRITLAFDGEGFLCRVGKATVFCVHGNEVDEWNVTDHEAIRRLGRDIMQGRPVTGWIPNAGTQLVVDIMNSLKSRYPFIDLLKPEMEAVVPILVALAPGQQDKLAAIAATARKLLWDKLRMATGFLGDEAESVPQVNALHSEVPAYTVASPYVNTVAMRDAGINYARKLLDDTETRYINNVDPVSLIDYDMRGQSLGLIAAIMKFARGEDKSEVLREALEKLQQDRSFVIDTADDTYKRLDEQLGEQLNFIVSGHTHLERAIKRKNGNGFYFNSGTWVRLIQLKEDVLKDKDNFKLVFEAFNQQSMEVLDTFKTTEMLVIRRLSVVTIQTDGGKTTGRLLHINPQPSQELFAQVDGSSFTYS